MIKIQHSYVSGSRIVDMVDSGKRVSYPRAETPKVQQLENNKLSPIVHRTRNGLIGNKTINQKKVVLDAQSSEKTKKTQTNKLANKDKKNVSPKMDVKSLDVRIEEKQGSLLGKYNHKMAGKPEHTQIGLLYEYVDAVKQAQVDLLWKYHDTMSHNR